MNAPPGQGTYRALVDAVVSYCDGHYADADKTGPMTCKRCGAEVEFVTMYVSVHYDEFPGCAGGGECRQLPLPFCPVCEGPPTRVSTCVHVPILQT